MKVKTPSKCASPPTPELMPATQNWAPPLTPKVAPWMQRLLQQPHIAKEWIENFGSPLHAVVVSEFKRNIADLRAAMSSRGVSGSLFFARKANKLPWFVRAAAADGIGVDTASLGELTETLALGVAPEQVVCTAIGKSRKLVTEAIGSGVLQVVDSFDELDLIASVAESLGKQARIGLRFSGFFADGRAVTSRFGLPVAESGVVLDKLDQSHWLSAEILHAHLDRYDTYERACAARTLLEIADLFKSRGHDINSLDLGGGILIRYLEHRQEWDDFLAALASSVRGERPSFTHQGDGFGYYLAGDELAGKPDLYPAFNDLSKERFIKAVLDVSFDGVPLHQHLSGRRMRLFFEPGRALLDNAGITLATVTFRKRDSSGNRLVGLAMNRTNLRPFRAEYCCDPFLLSGQERRECEEGAFLVGNLCSESDLIFRRRLRLSHDPQPEDVFCFTNTAGYLAHHLEVGTHGDPLPANVLVDSDTLEILDAVQAAQSVKKLSG